MRIVRTGFFVALKGVFANRQVLFDLRGVLCCPVYMIIVRGLILLFLPLYIILNSGIASAEQGDRLVCGIAEGYPPYQFTLRNGEPAGIDVEVIRKVAERLGKTIEFRQGPWDRILTELRLGRLDCISGMEINQHRKMLFDFTSPYYKRTVAVFVLHDSHIRSLFDLEGRVITGDRHSYVELHFAALGIKNKIRIHQTRSKEQSIQLLKKGEVVAMVAPKAVAYYLADQYGIKLRVLDAPDPGSPVGIAFEKGKTEMRIEVEQALTDLREEGGLDSIISKWQVE